MPRLSLNKICSLVAKAQEGDKEAFTELYQVQYMPSTPQRLEC